jgi:hypothetical protein
MMEGYLHKVVFSMVCNVELVNLSFKEMKFWTLAKKMMKVTKCMEDDFTFCKNGGHQNACHNGRNSQVSGGGFKKKRKKQTMG